MSRCSEQELDQPALDVGAGGGHGDEHNRPCRRRLSSPVSAVRGYGGGSSLAPSGSGQGCPLLHLALATTRSVWPITTPSARAKHHCQLQRYRRRREVMEPASNAGRRATPVTRLKFIPQTMGREAAKGAGCRALHNDEASHAPLGITHVRSTSGLYITIPPSCLDQAPFVS